MVGEQVDTALLCLDESETDYPDNSHHRHPAVTTEPLRNDWKSLTSLSLADILASVALIVTLVGA